MSKNSAKCYSSISSFSVSKTKAQRAQQPQCLPDETKSVQRTATFFFILAKLHDSCSNKSQKDQSTHEKNQSASSPKSCEIMGICSFFDKKNQTIRIEKAAYWNQEMAVHCSCKVPFKITRYPHSEHFVERTCSEPQSICIQALVRIHQCSLGPFEEAVGCKSIQQQEKSEVVAKCICNVDPG